MKFGEDELCNLKTIFILMWALILYEICLCIYKLIEEDLLNL